MHNLVAYTQSNQRLVLVVRNAQKRSIFSFSASWHMPMSKLPGPKSRYQIASQPFQMHGSWCGEHIQGNGSKNGLPSGLLRFSIFACWSIEKVETAGPKISVSDRKPTVPNAWILMWWARTRYWQQKRASSSLAAIFDFQIFSICWSIGFLHFWSFCISTNCTPLCVQFPFCIIIALLETMHAGSVRIILQRKRLNTNQKCGVLVPHWLIIRCWK